MRLVLISVVAAVLAIDAAANDFKGKVKDARTGEELIGAAVFVKEHPTIGATTGLDGSFVLNDIPKDKSVTIVCSYISYKTIEKKVNPASGQMIDFNMEAASLELEGVTVVARNPGRTEAGARGIERQSMNVVNCPSSSSLTRGDSQVLKASLAPKSFLYVSGSLLSSRMAGLISTSLTRELYGSSQRRSMTLMKPLLPSRAALAPSRPHCQASWRSRPLCQAMEERERMPGFSLRLLTDSFLVMSWLRWLDTSPK